MTDALEDLATHTRQLVDATTGNAADGYDTNTRAAVLRPHQRRRRRDRRRNPRPVGGDEVAHHTTAHT
jgi:hypothetical protein